MFMPGIYFEKKTRFLAYLTFLAAAVNVGANFILIHSPGDCRFGLFVVIGYITLAVSGYFVSQRLFRVPYELRRVALYFFWPWAVAFQSYFLNGPCRFAWV
jgi:O-antigen/teichoic acid export membrane protein